MTKEEFDNLKETLAEAIDDMESRTWRIQDALDNFRERLEEARGALDQLPAEDLNELITFGFIPGAKVKCNGFEFQFMGYTETGRMDFRDINGNSKFTDIAVCRKMLDRFTFLKDNEEKQP